MHQLTTTSVTAPTCRSTAAPLARVVQMLAQWLTGLQACGVPEVGPRRRPGKIGVLTGRHDRIFLHRHACALLPLTLQTSNYLVGSIVAVMVDIPAGTPTQSIGDAVD